MEKKKLNPLIIILLCAFCAVLITILVLYFIVGYRYVHDKEHGIKFIGMTKNGLAVDGKLFYSDGTKGTLDGETSSIILDSGEQYTGELSGLLPHGEGILKKADGTVYDGTFSNGQCTGKAHVSYVSGDVYDGDMVNGKREGRGNYTTKDGSFYAGEFTDGLKNGRGYSLFSDGSAYIGEYKNSIKEGFGAYLFPNGDIFVGEFLSDKRTGKGIYIWSKSEEFSTEFDEMFKIEFTEEFSDKFFEYFENGFLLHFTTASNTETEYDLLFWEKFEKILSRSQIEYYVGDFKENVLEGSGKYVWLSGRVLEGEFVDGQIKTEDETEKSDTNTNG